MANRRREPKNSPAEKRRDGPTPKRVPHEVVAVILGCLGVLSVLALLSYHAGDTSLNASNKSEVRNWIGPAGAYWADILLQLVGVSAYAFAVGLLLASSRALTARRVWPGWRELFGLLLTVASVGTLAHLLTRGQALSYPPGGILGALLGDWLREKIAFVGAFITTCSLVLIALAISVNGILAGLGVRGVNLARAAFWRVQLFFVALRERRRRHREKRAELHAELEAEIDETNQTFMFADDWIIGELRVEDKAERQRRLEETRAHAAALAERDAEREFANVRRRALRPAKEPVPGLGDAVDLEEEDSFELGALPRLDDDDDDKKSTNDGPDDGDDGNDGDDDGNNNRDVEGDLPRRTTARAAALSAPAPTPKVAPEAVASAASHAAPVVSSTPKRVIKRSTSAEPQIVNVRNDLNTEAIAAADKAGPEKKAGEHVYSLPSPALLDFEATVRAPVDPQLLRDNALRLTKTLKDYGIEGHVREIRPGPVVTMYEYVPAPGIKLSKIASLADDLAMSMEAFRVRIVAPIPGKGAVGIEIPNEFRETVFLKEIVAHESFKKARSSLTMAIGKDIEGGAYVTDLTRMPHLLVAGATGAGKSVSINTMIMSMLFRATPDDVRMIMVDPKMLELSVYDGIPHLLLPVVTDPKKAALALRWAVEEMERRYQLLSESGVRGIESYNKNIRAAHARGERPTLPPKKGEEEPRELHPLPYIVVIVDELADLMMVASRDVESSIMRLAQMARAAGIHLILATQRPSVDVITGVIKANFPTRIAFQVASRHDSRTIIDGNGAEHLLGRGDMLFLSPGAGGIVRVHGAFVSDEEIGRTVGFWKEQGTPEYDESILQPRAEVEGDSGTSSGDDFEDEAYDQALTIVTETRQASISMIQRRLRIGYNRAARLVERMETEGVVGPADGAKPREVLIGPAVM